MSKNSIASHYRGGEGENYSKGVRQDVLNHYGFQLQKKPFLPYLSTEMHVLDFGCGNGSLAKALQPYVASIEGVEINEYARNLAINVQNLIVYDGLGSLPEHKQYDAIVSNHVLEHIPDVISTLKLLKPHLAPGGNFGTGFVE